MYLTLCGLAWALIVLGVLLQRFSPVPYGVNLALIALGVLVGVVAFLWSLWALRGGFHVPVIGSLICASLPLLIVLLLVGKGFKAPVIHDVSTAPGEVTFVNAQSLRGAKDHKLEAPSAKVIALQKSAYPDVQPIVVPGKELLSVYEQAKAAAISLGWEIVYEDAPNRFEATFTSKLLKFVDDIALTCQQAEPGVVVNVRSVSRVGKSDLGANAARILAFEKALIAR